jgi:hypothetical protein
VCAVPPLYLFFMCSLLRPCAFWLSSVGNTCLAEFEWYLASALRWNGSHPYIASDALHRWCSTINFRPRNVIANICFHLLKTDRAQSNKYIVLVLTAFIKGQC